LEDLLKDLNQSLSDQDAETLKRFERLMADWEALFRKQQQEFERRFQELEERRPPKSESEERSSGLVIHLSSGQTVCFPDPTVIWSVLTTTTENTRDKLALIENRKGDSDIEKIIRGVFSQKSPYTIFVVFKDMPYSALSIQPKAISDRLGPSAGKNFGIFPGEIVERSTQELPKLMMDLCQQTRTELHPTGTIQRFPLSLRMLDLPDLDRSIS
jgi:hypothetical protein